MRTRTLLALGLLALVIAGCAFMPGLKAVQVDVKNARSSPIIIHVAVEMGDNGDAPRESQLRSPDVVVEPGGRGPLTIEGQPGSPVYLFSEGCVYIATITLPTHAAGSPAYTVDDSGAITEDDGVYFGDPMPYGIIGTHDPCPLPPS